MKTAFSRTFFSAMALLLVALLLVGVSFQALVRRYLKNEAIERLKNDSVTIAELASAYYTGGTLSGSEFFLNLSVASQVSDADAVICNAEGQLVLCSDAPLGCEHQGLVISQEYLAAAMTQDYTTHSGMLQGLYPDARYVVSVPFRDAASGEAVGIVVVSSPMSGTLAVLKRLTDTYLFVSVLVVLAATVVLTLHARKQSLPLREMAKAAWDFGHGRLDARVSVDSSSPEEVQELALAFNNMASSLQKSEYQRQEFVANVSHELKTPMTTIGGYIDGMLDGTIPPEKQRHYMRIVSDETKRLSRLVRSMLDISRLQDQAGIPEEKKNRFDISECAGRVLLTFEQKINVKGLNVRVEMPEHPIYTLADEDAITQVIYNLLDNAVKFCPAGGDLGLRLREGSDKVYVSIFNSGETIPPEELPLVFERFHKMDKSRSQNRDGWGLGLYIVKTIICGHGENISVTSRSGKTEFTFTLPLVI